MIDTETEGKLILDVGTGWGVVAIAAAERFEKASLVGLDFSSACLRLAKDAIRGFELRGRVSLIRGDAEAVPLRNAITDIIVSQATLNLVPNKSKAFSELARVSKIGGILSISDAIRKGRIGEGSPDLWCQCVTGALTTRELEQIMKSHGLEIIETSDLTAVVQDLVKTEKWDWPEFLEHDLAYTVVKARKK